MTVAKGKVARLLTFTEANDNYLHTLAGKEPTFHGALSTVLNRILDEHRKNHA